MFIEIILIFLGFTLLIYGADLLVKGATGIAKKFNISEIVIGLTVVAIGTSLPELVITMVSVANENTDLIVGNVIGSNLANLLLIIGIISILKPIKFEKSTRKVTIPLLLAINIFILLVAFGMFSDKRFVIERIHGIILLAIAAIYFIVPIINREKEGKEEERENINIIKSIINMIIGGIFLKYGGDFVVNSAVNIAHHINIPESVIGLTIVAIGTSLPEIVTSVVAILKGKNDIAVGNIIGSCIMNFCLIIGLGSILIDLPINSASIENLIVLLISTILIWLYSMLNKKNEIKRINGIIFIIIYLVYLISLFIR